jgi:hypothetical protein
VEMSKDDISVSIFGGNTGAWTKKKTVLGKTKDTRGNEDEDEGGAGVGQKGVTKQTGGQNEEEYRSKRKIDAFEILKRVPVFTGDGTEDVEEWLWKVNLIFDRFPDEQEELLEAIHYRLTGKAAQFFRVEGENVEDFYGFKEMFLQRFQGENEGVLESKFQQCQQAPGELVVDYAQRFKVLAIRLYGDYMQVKPVQMTVLRQFLSGLNGEIQRWVCSKNPGNFDEAFAEARREEDNVLMSRRQGKGLEGGGSEKIPKHIEDAFARLELVTRRAKGYSGENDERMGYSEDD